MFFSWTIKMESVPVHLIISLLIIFFSYSTAQTSIDFRREYMPLAVGNKWYYNIHASNAAVGSDVSIIFEIVGIDTIVGKKYFKIKYEKVNNNFPASYYHQRMSNDTLYALNYDEKYNDYFERVAAIFSLDSGEVASIELPSTNLTLKYEADGLPTGRQYSLEVLSKDENMIELFYNSRMIDGDHTEIFTKGIGMTKSKNDWGIVMELIDYELIN
jgi:hypothetical protein